MPSISFRFPPVVHHPVLFASVLALSTLPLFVAQSQSPPVKEPRQLVTVAIVDSMPARYSQYAVLVMRSSDPAVGDVVVMPRDRASGRMLVQASRALVSARARQGERPKVLNGKSFRLEVLGVRPSAGEGITDVEIVKAQRVVDILGRPDTPHRVLPLVGDSPALRMFPPRTPTAQNQP